MIAYNQDVFDAIKYLHILAAMIWLGTSISLQFTATRLARAAEPERMATFAKDAEYTGTHLIMPSTMLLLLLGIAMVAYSPVYGFTQTWILLAFAGFAATFVAATFVTGAFVIGPTSGRIGGLIERDGPASPEAQALIRRVFAVSRIDLVVLLLVVADMVFKPGV
jgi:uncharacterized membrane protein